MLILFAKAMTRWAGSGFKLTKRDEFLRRRTICAECNDGWRCPDCGCVLNLKGAIQTEKCPRKLWEIKE